LGALALGLTLSLAGCAADEIGARATLEDYGLRGVSIALAPAFGRPCRLGEPYAVRFVAHDEAGADVRGWLCAVDEAAEDARILFDQEGA
jgi:hypothetical protein